MPYLGRYFIIKSRLNGYVLDITGERMTSGTYVITYPYHGKDNQLWYKDPESDAIRSKCDNDFVLDLNYDNKLVINKFSQYKSTQAWRCSGDYLYLKYTKKVVSISNRNSKAGATLMTKEKYGDHNQRWIFEYQPRKYFQIMSRLNGKCLDVCEGNRSSGVRVFMFRSHGRENQLWYEDESGYILSKLNGFTFKSTHYGLETTPIDPEVAIVKRGNYLESKNKNIMQCLDICEENRRDRAKVILYNKHGGSNQQWYYKYV